MVLKQKHFARFCLFFTNFVRNIFVRFTTQNVLRNNYTLPYVAEPSVSSLDSAELENLNARLAALRNCDDQLSSVTTFISTISPCTSHVSLARHYQTVLPNIDASSHGIVMDGRTEL